MDTPRAAHLKAKQYLDAQKGKVCLLSSLVGRIARCVGVQDVEVFGTDNQTEVARILLKRTIIRKLGAEEALHSV